MILDQAKREMRAQLKADRKTGGGGLKNSGQSQQLKQIQANLTEFLHRDGDLWGLPPMTDTLLRQVNFFFRRGLQYRSILPLGKNVRDEFSARWSNVQRRVVEVDNQNFFGFQTCI